MTSEELRNEDPDVQLLERWALSMNLNSNQFNALCAIVEVTVKHKLQEFSKVFLEMDIITFRKEQTEQLEEFQNKKGLWSE